MNRNKSQWIAKIELYLSLRLLAIAITKNNDKEVTKQVFDKDVHSYVPPLMKDAASM